MMETGTPSQSITSIGYYINNNTALYIIKFIIILIVLKTATLSLDDCDTALSVKHGHLLGGGGKYRCAARVTHQLESRCDQFTETCHRFLDLTAPLQLGGLPSTSGEFQVRQRDYDGCIRDLYIDHQFIDLSRSVYF